ncbi:MAG: flagellar protein FlaG [Clostridiaceae bacterium]|nr:flagellar protein FlaG [Clostridiaceae bacterium]
MEIKGYSQGGQPTFDNSTINNTGNLPMIVSEKVNTITTQPADRTISDPEIKKAVEKLNKFMEDDNTRVEYQFHSKFNDLMIKIIDKDTGVVIIEVPPKKILDMVAKMCELVGILFDRKG